MNKVWDDYGYILGSFSGAPEIFCHSNKKLETAADLKGLKFRTFGMWAEILATYGVSVVTLPGGELYSAMERGVIDAFELGPPSYNWTLGFHEICQYIGVPAIHSPGYCTPVIVNKASWDKLPSGLQTLVNDEVMATSLYSYLAFSAVDAEALNNYREYGTEIFTVSDELQADIARKGREHCQQYVAEDPLFREVWDHQTAFFKVWKGLSPIVPKYSMFD